MKDFRSHLAEMFEQPWLHIETMEDRRPNGWLFVNYIYADPRSPEDYTKYLMIIFEQQNTNSWALLFTRGSSFAASGQGDAGGVFASVLDAAGKFLKKHKPEFITFSALKEGKSTSRERAYAALVKRFASKYGYALDHKESGDFEAIWKLRRGGA